MAEKEILIRIPKSVNKYILRSGAIFGCTAGFKPTTVLNKFIFEAHFLNKIQIFGSGNQRRSFIHVDRLSEVISRILFNTKLETGIYNIYDYSFSVNELADILKKLYPTIDLIYMNRDHEMKSMEIESIFDFKKILNLKKPKEIEDCIKEDTGKFSF